MPNRPAPHDELTSYEKFHRLCARPFSLTPDLRFTYQSRSHARAFEQVAEALRHRDGIVVITGEIGTGKTMLSRALLEQLREARTFLSVVFDPMLTVDDLLYQVLVDFGVTPKGTRPHHRELDPATRHQLVSALHQFVRGLIALNGQAVILVDEAQHLGPNVLEQLRLLSNLETDAAKVLQIVLVGQPDLEAILKRPDMRQLEQRVARRIELQPLDAPEVEEYVERRLAIAACPDAAPGTGGSSLAFTAKALRDVARISGGIPRVINTLCDRALEVGAERQTSLIDDAVVADAARRLKLGVLRKPPRAVAASLAAVAVIVVAAGVGLWWRAPTVQAPASAPTRAAAPPATAAPPAANPTPASSSEATPPPAAPSSASAPTAARSQAPASPPAASPPSASAPAAPAAQARPAPPDQGRFRIIVAAFKTSKRAIDVAEAIAAKGMPATSRPDPGGTWFLVIVGPYPSMEAAQSAQQALERSGFEDTRVVADPGGP